jgi:hypothetical protein
MSPCPDIPDDQRRRGSFFVLSGCSSRGRIDILSVAHLDTFPSIQIESPRNTSSVNPNVLYLTLHLLETYYEFFVLCQLLLLKIFLRNLQPILRFVPDEMLDSFEAFL